MQQTTATTILTSSRALERLSTIAISTFLLELTIQRTSSKTNNNNLRQQQSVSVDDLIQSVAENHLAVVYSNAFKGVPPPSQVLLTVVTSDNQASSGTGGYYIRSSFVGGVVSFPTTDTLTPPTSSELEEITIDAFAIPGNGESFLDALLEREHPDLKGLLLIGAREVKNEDENSPINDTPEVQHDEDGNVMNNIWAIAAVSALGAMFLTILLCTTVLYCDWRKRRARRDAKRNAGGKSTKSAGRGSSLEDMPFDEPLRIVIPNADSGETDVDNTPSPSTQASDEVAMKGGVNHNNVGKGSLIGNMSSIVNKSRRSLPAMSKSKAANAELKASRSDEEDSYAPGVAPSVIYSVGEDTTMLYPTINRGRSNSRDMSEFDGYSMDGMSTMEGGFGTSGSENNSNKHSNSSLQNGNKSRDVMYSGEVPRDFDSVWDDESKMTMSVINGMDDDSILGKSVEGPVVDSVKETYVDLTQSLNQLVEQQYEDGSRSKDSNGLHEFDSESESGSSSNRGAFTLELLGKGKKSRKSMAGDDDDSILGDMYGDGASEAGEESTISVGGEGNVPSSGDSVDSTPSWAAPIQSVLRSQELNTSSETEGEESNVKDIFRATPPTSPEAPAVENASTKESQERTKDKFVSSLSSNSLSKMDSDDRSVGSNRSSRSNSSRGSRKSTSGGDGADSSPKDRALGLTNSMDEEVDEDPADMIENINSMLSECRVILDTDTEAPLNLN
jgi:hypothetical protein